MKIAIIGAGAVGMGVANKLAKENSDLVIHVFQEKKYISLGACGIPYFVANDFKKPDLLNARKTKDFKGAEFKSTIHFHLNTIVTHIDTNKKEIQFHKIENNNEKSNFKFDYLVIATGAKPNIIPPYSHGSRPKNLFNATTKEDAINIKKAITNFKKLNKNNTYNLTPKVAIVGGSYIGLEMAEACLQLKADVTIFEAEDRLMKRVVDEEFSALIYNEITGRNLSTRNKKGKYAKVVLNCKTDELLMQGNVIRDIKTNQDDGKLFACDLVILATGVSPSTELLEKTDIKLAKNNAIITNEYGQVLINTSSDKNNKKSKNNFYPNIFAAGDCSTVLNHNDQTHTYIPLATTANKIARLIAHNIMSNTKKESFPGTLGSSILRIKTLEIAVTGIKDQNWKKDYINNVFIESYDLPNYMPESKPLYLKLFYDKSSYQILGAQMAGYNHATLRINALVTAIWNKMDVRELEYLDLVYSPPFAKTTDIIHIAARKVKKI